MIEGTDVGVKNFEDKVRVIEEFYGYESKLVSTAKFYIKSAKDLINFQTTGEDRKEIGVYKIFGGVTVANGINPSVGYIPVLTINDIIGDYYVTTQKPFNFKLIEI